MTGRFAYHFWVCLSALQLLTGVAIIDPVRAAVVGHLTVGETPDGVAYTTRVVATSAPPR
jgi:hypothetical protein